MAEQNEQEKQFKERLLTYCDEKGIRKIDGIWKITPRPNLPQTLLARLYQWLKIELNADYSNLGEFTLTEIYGTQQISESEQSANIPLDKLLPGPSPRLDDGEDSDIDELANDLDINGQKQRIIVFPSNKLMGYFEIIDGNRRKKGAKKLFERGLTKWATLRAVIMNLTEQEAFELAAIFFHRKDLTPLEWGRHFYLCMKNYPQTYPSQRAVAKKYGYKSPESVNSLIHLWMDHEGIIELPNAKPTVIDVVATDEIQKITIQPDILPRPETKIATVTDKTSTQQTDSQPQQVYARAYTKEPSPVTQPRQARIIHSAPEEIKPELIQMVRENASTRDLEAKIEEYEQTKEDPLLAAQADYAQAEKTEATKQRSLINSLKKYYPTTMLEDIVLHFNRVEFGGLTTEKLNVIAAKITVLEHAAAKEAGLLEDFYRQVEEEL